MLVNRARKTAAFDLEQKLQRLQMTSRFGYRLTPSIESMAAEQHTMRRHILQGVPQLVRKCRIILRIFKNRHLFAMLVRRNALQALEQFIAPQRNVASVQKHAGKQGIPDCVHMQNRARFRPLAIDHCVQACLC